MKIILLQDVKSLGKKGERVKINDGYARNFVLPKKLGIEATAKNFVGPMGIMESERNKGIGKALMLKCLLSMKEMGYAYAIIGSSSEKNIKFHQKVSNAQVISSDTLGIYTRMVNID